jgi:ABC-type nickel/cobalt efflux system permease component RcnA
VARLQHWQRRLNDALARQLRVVRRGEPGAVATVLLVALAYGVLHALGPGHGKAVVASLFLGRRTRLGRAIVVGFLVSFLQILSSIAAVTVLGLVLGHGGFAVARETVWVEIVSYALVALLGIWMTLRAVAGASHDHGTKSEALPGTAPGGWTGPGIVSSERASPAVSGLILAAGLTPCPSGIIVLLFALANQVLLVGLEACLVMALGMGATVSAIGVGAVLLRRGALAPLHTRPRALAWASRGLAIGGSLTLTVVGGLLLAGAWTRLP